MFSSSPFLIALQFLTVIPVRIEEPDNEATGCSLLYYPLVGLLIGLLLEMIGWMGSGMPSNLHAAVVLTFWVVITGALHLDGLADSADAWIGGLGDPKKTIAIMKDPCCGPVAVVTLVLVLLIKFTALAHILTIGYLEVLVLAPVLGRTALVMLFLTTPYVRPNGLGTLLSNHLPRRTSLVIILFTFATVPLFMGIAALWLLIALAGTFIVLRALMLKRIDGTTGDTAGALVEMTETIMLLAAILIE
ncbi:MAG: adenosylcobinamide-GDP ribazoletransferase [Sedimenticolaceae bacterium]